MSQLYWLSKPGPPISSLSGYYDQLGKPINQQDQDFTDWS